MYTLVIETSTERGIVALLKGSSLVQSSHLPFGYSQSNHLLPYIQNLFVSAKISPHEIDLIGVGIGPGSYTGIRVGAAVAKTIAYACRKPLAGICTLEAFIPQDYTGPFAAIIDAKISGCYLLKGHYTGEKAIYDSKPQVVALDALQHEISQDTLLVTPYAQNLKAKVDAACPNNMWKWVELPPCPTQLGSLARVDGGSLDAQLDLLYLRETQAEVEKKLKKDNKENDPCS